MLDATTLLGAWRERDALLGASRFPGGLGRAIGIDREGRLLIQGSDGTLHALGAGEVHLGPGAYSSIE